MLTKYACWSFSIRDIQLLQKVELAGAASQSAHVWGHGVLNLYVLVFLQRGLIDAVTTKVAVTAQQILHE